MNIFSYFTKQKQSEERSCSTGSSILDFSFLNASCSYINESNVYQITVVKACVEMISDTIAGLSHNVYQKTDNGRIKLDNHRVQQTLINPNELQTGFTFKQTMQSFPLINGNAYAWIDGGKLYILNPTKTNPCLKDGVLTYETYVNNKKEILTPDQVFHIPGLGNGIKGMSPIDQARKTLELASSCVEFGKSFFENGSQLGGFLKSPRKYKLEEAQNLLGSFNAKHQGARRAFKVGLLEEGMDYMTLGVAPEQAQFLETRKFSDKQIATQLFKIPAHILDLEPTTVNYEQRMIQFAQMTLLPWVKRWEQEINRKLFTEKEKKDGIYFEFNLDSVQRADIVTRYNAINSSIQNGWRNRDEARELENLTPLPDGQGQVYLTPLNMVNSNQLVDPQDPQDQQQQNQADATGNQMPDCPTCGMPMQKMPNGQMQCPDCQIPTNMPGCPTCGMPMQKMPNGQMQCPDCQIPMDMPMPMPKVQQPMPKGPNTPVKARGQGMPTEALTRLVEDGARRVLTKETNKIKNAVKHNLRDSNNPAAFRTFIDGFYVDYQTTIRETMQPILETIGANLDKFVEEHVAESRKQLAVAMWSDDAAKSIEESIGTWAENRSKEIAKITLEENE